MTWRARIGPRALCLTPVVRGSRWSVVTDTHSGSLTWSRSRFLTDQVLGGIGFSCRGSSACVPTPGLACYPVCQETDGVCVPMSVKCSLTEIPGSPAASGCVRRMLLPTNPTHGRRAQRTLDREGRNPRCEVTTNECVIQKARLGFSSCGYLLG